MHKKINKQQKNILKLLIRGQTNNFGNQIYDYANKLIIASLSKESSYFMGLYQSSESISGILFNLIGGVVADQKDRKKILVLSDILSAVCTFIIFLNYKRVNTWGLIIVNIILAILYSFNAPAYKAIVKNLLFEKYVYKYNSYSKSISEVINVSSPLLGMLIIKGFGFRIGMLVNALSFLISAMVEYSFSYKKNIVINIKDKRNIDVIFSLKGAWRYILKSKELMVVLVMSGLVNFFLAGYNFSLPFVNNFSGTTYLYAHMLTSASIGNIIGSLLNGLMGKNLKIKAYCHLLLGVAIPCIIIGFFKDSEPVLILCTIASMAFLTAFNIQLMSGVQAKVDDKYIGRIFSIIFTISSLFVPLGTYVFTILNIMNWTVFSVIGVGIILMYIFAEIAIELIK